MNFFQKLHMLHSAWHYRINTEKEDIRFLMNQDLKGRTVIDIGANKGIYSYWMSKKAGPDGKVVAFEPQPELEKHLIDFKKSFKLENLHIINKGLSSGSSVRELFRPESGSGAARLNNEGVDWPSISISLSTLDSYCEDFSNVAFIKCDVEGHEFHVFKGGQRLLKRDKPCLLFECHHDEAEKQDLFLYLTSLGYDGFFSRNGRMIHFSKFSEYPYRRKIERHRNYIFIHKEILQSGAMGNQCINRF